MITDMKAYQAEWYQKNKEKSLKKRKERYDLNKEHEKELAKNLYSLNKEKRNKQSREWALNNPEKRKATLKKYRDKNPSYRRNAHLKKKYGITQEDFDRMFLEQDGRCLICNTHQSELKTVLCVDHSHETGKVRGLLCQRCNVGIGKFEDNINFFKRIIEYLQLNQNA